MKKIDEILGLNVKARRNALRFTQDFLASEAGTDISTIQRIEAGTRWPSAETVAAIAAALKVEPSALYQPDLPVVIKPTPAEALEVLRGLVKAQQKPESGFIGEITRLLAESPLDQDELRSIKRQIEGHIRAKVSSEVGDQGRKTR